MANVKMDRGTFDQKAGVLRSKLKTLQDVVAELPAGTETTKDVDRAMSGVTRAWEELRDLVMLGRP